jgi:hypothetical protein
MSSNTYKVIWKCSKPVEAGGMIVIANDEQDAIRIFNERYSPLNRVIESVEKFSDFSKSTKTYSVLPAITLISHNFGKKEIKLSWLNYKRSFYF